MDSAPTLTLPLAHASRCDDSLVGGKAIGLGRLIDAGYRVPDGFCISTVAYERFVAENALKGTLDMELGRKDFSSMRWEEIWDTALRIRAAFLAGTVPEDIVAAITAALQNLQPGAMVVRSSAPGEDSESRSYAGLHESLVGVVGADALLDAVRVVWASLWSDAAMLYRQELDMDPRRSRMAVVVQTLVTRDVSGVGFGVDPRQPADDRQVIEAVPGPCEGLVSGAVDPDRWIVKRSSGEIVEWRPGQRGSGESGESRPLLQRADLGLLHETLNSVESLMGWPADVEWTGDAPSLVLLQARPVTGSAKGSGDEREWYLSLRPGRARLDELCRRVSEQLIPELEAEASRLAGQDIDSCDNAGLAAAIEERKRLLAYWKGVYRDEFIPFAHGVRQLGTYYNDAVRPDDPYEFVGLLRNQPMIASRRNKAIRQLSTHIRAHPRLAGLLESQLDDGQLQTRESFESQASPLAQVAGGKVFVSRFRALLDDYMNVVFEDQPLDDRPDLVVRIVLELAAGNESEIEADTGTAGTLEGRLLAAVGADRRNEALDVLRVARLSWQLRDDDNILIGRLENQLRRALDIAAARLRADGRLDRGATLGFGVSGRVVEALRDSGRGALSLPPDEPVPSPALSLRDERPRQMVGQPAAPGLATGRVRVVRHVEDIGTFHLGEVLVCDAIQPTMTHLLPLAAAVIERRGGMLIHGAIIAREMGIPCVNGVVDAADKLQNGDVVTVDGYLGIVTVGPPEFDVELGAENGRKG